MTAPPKTSRRTPRSPAASSPSEASRRFSVLPSLPLHHQLLGERLYLYCIARYLLAALIVIGALFARYAVEIENLNVSGLILVAVCLSTYNIAVFLIARRYRRADVTPATRHLLIGVMNASITLDYIFLTVVIWLLGGAQSPFKVFYLLHVMIAAVLLPERMSFAHSLIGYLLFASLVLLEWTGILTGHYPVGAVPTAELADTRYVLTVLVVQAVMIAVTLFFLTNLMRFLRRGDAQLREANLEITRFSEIQRNFLRIAVHDVKAPVGAAQSFLYNLQAGIGGEINEKQAKLIAGALRRLDGVTALVHDFEVLTTLETFRLDEQGQAVDIATLIREIVLENQDLAEIRSHSLELELPATLPSVIGIERLLKEAVANLVNNAIKYTPNGGRIRVRAFPFQDQVRIEVEDNGIGITPEEQDRLFQDFSRLRKKDAPKAEGSGLGLTIVRRIAEMHGGQATVKSDGQTGSTFIIDLPQNGRDTAAAS
ncbi:HAMP domain-containing histidine kinase [bacterium]|nr:HAMP domain-containing histidine kinase [bacterium]